ALLSVPSLLYGFGDPCALRPFPTRRSSDLVAVRAERELVPAHHAALLGAHQHPVGLRQPHGRPSGPRFEPGSAACREPDCRRGRDRKSTRLNSSYVKISYAVICLKKKTATS